MKPRLYTPGPTEIPRRVITAMSARMPHLRSEEFRAIFREVSEKLKGFFKTDHEVLTFTASGTGAMEAALINFMRQGEKVISIEGGKFGKIWAQIGRTYGLNVVTLEAPWGDAPTIDQVKQIIIDHTDAAAVLITHSETSTGTAFDVQRIAEVVRQQSNALVMVDGISSIGVMPFHMDDWNVDICIAGSQKGAMIPPGLSFMAVNERGWERARASDLPKYYFSCLKARESLENGDTPFTSAISLIMGLRESLDLTLRQGMEARWQEYARLAHALRTGAQAIGLELFSKHPASSVTAIRVPSEIDGRRLIATLHDNYGAHVAGGQDHLKGKIFRVAQMGYCDHLDMIGFAAVMELALRDCGWRFEIGAAVAATQCAYASQQA